LLTFAAVYVILFVVFLLFSRGWVVGGIFPVVFLGAHQTEMKLLWSREIQNGSEGVHIVNICLYIHIYINGIICICMCYLTMYLQYVHSIAYIEVANIIAYFMQRCTEQTSYFPASIGICQFSIRWGHFYFGFFF